MHVELSNMGGHCFTRSQHLLTITSSHFILLLCKSFGFFDPFLMPRSTSMLERNSATKCHVKTHLCIVLSDDEKPIIPLEKEMRLLLEADLLEL